MEVDRDGDADDEPGQRWARETRTSIESVQDAVSTAVRNLNTDGRAATTALRGAQSSYTGFSARYDQASSDFIAAVDSARQEAAVREENLNFIANTALAVFFPQLAAAKSAADGVLGNVVGALRLASAVSPASPGTGPREPSGESRLDPGRSTRIRWNSLLETTLSSWESNLSGNETLATLGSNCISSVRFLRRVLDGTAGDDPQSSAAGQSAQRLAQNSQAIIRRLGTIGTGEVSGPARNFATNAATELDGRTKRRIEQDIASRWISGLGRTQLDEIDDADAYLKRIGVIDSAGNRLGNDTGSITSDIDETLIQMKARARTAAMEHVGSSATWLGGRVFMGGMVSGRIRDDRNMEWNANAPAGTPTEGGGSVRIEGYHVTERELSTWSYPSDLQRILYQDIWFRVSPVGQLSGGASRPGPVLHAPD